MEPELTHRKRMAKGKATPASFKPGDPRAVAAGKKSSRALPPDVKEARALRAVEFESIINRYMDLDLAGVQAVMKNPSTPIKDLIVLKMVELALKNGDLPRVNFLLDRTIGPLQNSVKVDGTLGIYKLHDLLMKEIEGGE